MPTSTAPTSRDTQGELSNDKNLLEEPPDHAIGKSRSGLTSKVHSLVDGRQSPLVMMLGPGQGGDSPMFENLLDALKVKNPTTGTTRTRPERAMAGKAYSSRGNRKYLRDRGIQCVIPEKDDQKANRKRKGSAGGPPVIYDKEVYKRRNVVERSFNALKQWRGMATRYDKLALDYHSGVVLHAVLIWSTDIEKSQLGDAP